MIFGEKNWLEVYVNHRDASSLTVMISCVFSLWIIRELYNRHLKANC